MSVYNPIATRELFDILKGQRSVWSLFAYVMALSGAIYLSWPKTNEYLSVSDQISRQIFVHLAFWQILLVAVLSPIFSAGALTKEREEDTFDILLTSPMSPHAIIWGKFQSAFSFLIIIVLSSLPVAAVIFPLGGVGVQEVTSLYVISLAEAAVAVGIGLLCSAYFHRTHSSLMVSYLIILPLSSLLIYLATSGEKTFFSNPDTMWWIVALGLGALTTMYFKLVSQVTREMVESPKPAGEEDISQQTGLVLRRDVFPDWLFLPEKSGRPIGSWENPIFKKEMRSELLGSGTLFVRMVIQVGLFLAVFFIPSIVSGRIDYFFAYLTVVMCLVAPSLAAGMFSQERERGTLDLLLTTTLPPGQVLWGKVLAMVRYSLVLAGFFMCAHLVAYFFSLRFSSAVFVAMSRLAVYILVSGITVLTVTVIAGFFSIRTLSTFTASIATYVTLLVLYVGPFGALQFLTVYTSISEAGLRWLTVTSPFGPLLVDPMADLMSLLSGTPRLWHGYVMLSLLLCLSLARYVERNYDALTTPGERGARG
ncbi:MAG: ABC transporter permease [Candidatus Riflebacteria bacterium]|nr:ABC transporter permease [Candidatus Riflebacteria bacterium]